MGLLRVNYRTNALIIRIKVYSHAGMCLPWQDIYRLIQSTEYNSLMQFLTINFE